MKKNLALYSLCAGLLTALANPANLESEKPGRTPILLELFTSEGCSSCPPADRLLQTLDQKQPYPNLDLIVLSEHVDYWNGGGWTDPYSSSLFSSRQNRYAEQFGLDEVYTPQLVVDGGLEGVGSNLAQTQADIEKAARAMKTEVTLSEIVRSGDEIKLHVSSASFGPGATQATFYIALAQDAVRSEVRKGENAGRSLTHVAVVRSLIPVSRVKSGVPFSKDVALKVPPGIASKGIRVVAFLQLDKTQRIIGVSQSRL